MARCIHARLLPHSSRFGLDSAELSNFRAFFFPTVWIGSKVVELLAFNEGLAERLEK